MQINITLIDANVATFTKIAAALADTSAVVSTTHAERASDFNADAKALEVIQSMLADTNYTLRSEFAIVAKVNEAVGYEFFLARQELLNFLDDAGVAYYTKRRRSDGALLIGQFREPVAESVRENETPASDETFAVTAKEPYKFKVGDKVRVVRRVTEEAGWEARWVGAMDSYVDNVLVYEVSWVDNRGVHIGLGYAFPHGALELVTEVAPVAEPVPSKLDSLRALLEDPSFTWRTFDTLVNKTGYLNADEITEALDDSGISYDTTFRFDGKRMIALTSRL